MMNQPDPHMLRLLSDDHVRQLKRRWSGDRLRRTRRGDAEAASPDHTRQSR